MICKLPGDFKTVACFRIDPVLIHQPNRIKLRISLKSYAVVFGNPDTNGQYNCCTGWLKIDMVSLVVHFSCSESLTWALLVR